MGEDTGRLVKGRVLVSNFNAKTNLQGTGTTICRSIRARSRAACSPRSTASTYPARARAGWG